MNRAVTGSLDVSIALATYNGEKHILQQLKTLSAQTLLPAELVITDDGSTDRTLDIAAEFGQTSPFPVRIFRNEPRLGYAENFLRAASLCTSPLIAFCDQDDAWRPNKFETIVPFFDDPEVMLACHTSALWDGEQLTGDFYPHFGETTIHQPVSVDPFILVPGFSIVFRAEILKYISNSNRPRHTLNLGSHDAPEPMAHDAWVLFLATSIGRVVTITDTLAHYRQHGSNVKGAPDAADGRSRLLWAIGMTGYAELSKLEAHCAAVTDDLSNAVPPSLQQNVLLARNNFRTRSRFHHLRSVIYSPGSNIFQRFASSLKLLFSGAYGSDTARTRLGPRAAVKDILFGVPALSRWIKQS